jgi:hypothetical protein
MEISLSTDKKDYTFDVSKNAERVSNATKSVANGTKDVSVNIFKRLRNGVKAIADNPNKD